MTTALDERSAFVAAIIAEPRCDIRRLAFADWLDEHGQTEWAHLIRLQCRLAGGLLGVTRDKVRAEAFSLLMHGKLADRVADGFEPIDVEYAYGDGESVVVRLFQPGLYNLEGEAIGAEIVWRRGFIAEVHCPLAVWQEHGPRLVREHPIERVRLTDKAAMVNLPFRGEREGAAAWGNSDFLITPPPPESLPGGIYALLQGHWPTVATQAIPVKIYATAQEAEDASSRACIAWAKLQPS